MPSYTQIGQVDLDLQQLSNLSPALIDIEEKEKCVVIQPCRKKLFMINFSTTDSMFMDTLFVYLSLLTIWIEKLGLTKPNRWFV